jgi:hypothetical protein
MTGVKTGIREATIFLWWQQEVNVRNGNTSMQQIQIQKECHSAKQKKSDQIT